jgi:Raf kinase inhibitor-like YbhB/YbcL family protein
MWLRSSAFDDGSAIPREFTGEGEDVSPPLDWDDAPNETRSFVVLCDDPDAPSGTWHHWAAYDIPVGLKCLPVGAAAHAVKQGFQQALNDFGKPGYGGPYPPRSDGPHHYRFRLLALSGRARGAQASHRRSDSRRIVRALRCHEVPCSRN